MGVAVRCVVLLLLLVAGGWGVETEPVFTDQEWTKLSGTPAPGQPAPPAAGSSTGSGLLLLAGAVLLIAVIVVALGWLTKRFALKRMMPGKGRHIEVVDTVAIGFKRTVSVVRLGEHVLVVGCGEHELTALATLPAATALPAAPVASAAAAAAPAAEPAVAAFQEKLAKLLKGGTP